MNEEYGRDTGASTLFDGGRSSYCEQTFFESAADFTLPDYMPEIARMLKATARVVPSSRYVGSGKAEFCGNVVYSILYAGEDGTPFFTTLSGDYEYTVPLKLPSEVTSVRTYDEVTAESVSVRPSAPRRFSVRCRLKAAAYFTHEGGGQPQETLASEDSDGLQKLMCNVSSSHSIPFESGEFECECDVAVGADPDAEYIGCDGNVLIEELSAVPDAVICKGELEYKIYYHSIEQGRRVLCTTSGRVRFERQIYASHPSDIGDVRAVGTLVSLEMNRSEESPSTITLSAIINVGGECVYEKTTPLLKDVYRIGKKSEAEYTQTEYARSVLCRNANVSLHTQSEQSLSGEHAVCACFASASVSECVVRENKVEMLGEAIFDVVVKNNTPNAVEYKTVSIPVPFKCETSSACFSQRYEYRCNVVAGAVRARIDSGCVVADAELYISARVMGKMSERTVSELHVSDVTESDSSALTVYYPSKDESLWSVAKKYAVSIDKLCKENDLRIGVWDKPDCLAGVPYLVVS